jgi:hypothetical protein
MLNLGSDRLATMHESVHSVTAELWRHPGEAGWHFVTLPPELAGGIRARSADSTRAFGSVPVRVAIGRTSSSTSLFADTRTKSYLLPVKAEVRRREGIGHGDAVVVAITLE